MKKLNSERNGKILVIIGDKLYADPDYCQLYTLILQSQGYEVRLQSYDSSQEIITTISSFQPQLIIWHFRWHDYSEELIAKVISTMSRNRDEIKPPFNLVSFTRVPFGHHSKLPFEDLIDAWVPYPVSPRELLRTVGELLQKKPL